jgi:hypothetical protein
MIFKRATRMPETAALQFPEWASLFSGKLLVKLVAYVDESGTHDKTGKLEGSREVVVAGWVAWRDEWVNFCSDWQAVLNKYDAPYFHFKEWSAASAIIRKKRKPFSEFKQNPYRGWKLKDLDRFLQELANIAGSGNKIMIGGYVNTLEFHKAAMSPSIDPRIIPSGGDPYKHCLDQFFKEFLIEVQQQWPYWTEPVSFFFDQSNNPEWRNAVVGAFYSYKDKDSRLAVVSFADKKSKEHLPLQAADMIAYRCRQIAGKYIDQGMLGNELPELDKALFKGPFKVFEANKEKLFLAYISGLLSP